MSDESGGVSAAALSMFAGRALRADVGEVSEMASRLIESEAAVARLTVERDKAREDCGFEKGMRAALRVELDMFIRLNMESTARAEVAEQALTDYKAAVETILAEWDEAIEPDGTTSFIAVRTAAVLMRASLVVAGGASTTRETPE